MVVVCFSEHGLGVRDGDRDGDGGGYRERDRGRGDGVLLRVCARDRDLQIGANSIWIVR